MKPPPKFNSCITFGRGQTVADAGNSRRRFTSLGFGPALENYFKGKKVKARAFVVKLFTSVDEVKACQMLFIGTSEKSRFGQILSQLDDASILTISDSDGFLQKNGMIFMFMTAKSEISSGLGWDINVEAMKRARLQIDPFFIEKARKPDR